MSSAIRRTAGSSGTAAGRRRRVDLPPMIETGRAILAPAEVEVP